jgi:hypothetical protein
LVAGTVSGGNVPLSWVSCTSKEIVLTPEYAGAVLDSGGASNDLASIAAGFDSSQRESYYVATTTQSSNQVYDVVAQIPLPSDFSSWGTTPITIDAKTTDTTNGTVTAKLYDTTGTIETNWNTCSLTPSSANTWQTKTGCTLSGTYTANGVVTLRVILQVPSGGSTQIGNIVLNYNSSL